ncbi:MAG: hypothetical protein AAF385_11495 [Pseudomonadota bacterium]
MKNKIEDLRNHLFETIEALKDPDNPMDIKRAMAIKQVADGVVSTAKVELQHMELTGHDGTGFIPSDSKPALPASGSPRLVSRQ